MKTLIVSVLFSVLVLPAAGLTASEPATAFKNLLAEAGMELLLPEGFADADLRRSDLLQYEKAVRHQQNGLEVRYAIRPLGRIEIDYNDPHSAMPEPNHMFNMLFHTLVGNLTKRGSRSPAREYSKDESQRYFNADWAAVAVFDVVPEYTENHSQAMLLGLHRNDKADAYAVFLFNDYASVKDQIAASITALKFGE